jgi:hypothetical protein
MIQAFATDGSDQSLSVTDSKGGHLSVSNSYQAATGSWVKMKTGRTPSGLPASARGRRSVGGV